MQANAAMLAVVLLGNWMLPFAASQNGKDADLAQMSLLLKVTCRRSDRLLRIFFFSFCVWKCCISTEKGRVIQEILSVDSGKGWVYA